MKLLLCGGGSGEQVTSAYEKLNEIINHDKPILYIPLAMSEEEHSYDSCHEWIYQELKSVSVPRIDMVRTFEELENKNYDDYSTLFIGGGNTYKLLKGLKKTKSFDKIREYLLNDGLIIGSSAGSIIFGEDIDIIAPMDPNDVELKDTKGFNMLSGISIFPHYRNGSSYKEPIKVGSRTEMFQNYIKDFSKTHKVIAIPEEDSIYFDGENIEIIGKIPYYTFENGIEEMHEIVDNNRYIKKF